MENQNEKLVLAPLFLLLLEGRTQENGNNKGKDFSPKDYFLAFVKVENQNCLISITLGTVRCLSCLFTFIFPLREMERGWWPGLLSPQHSDYVHLCSRCRPSCHPSGTSPHGF